MKATEAELEMAYKDVSKAVQIDPENPYVSTNAIASFHNWDLFHHDLCAKAEPRSSLLSPLLLLSYCPHLLCSVGLLLDRSIKPWPSELSIMVNSFVDRNIIHSF